MNNTTPTDSSRQSQSVTDRMKEQVRKRVLQYAIFRPESAIVLALAILGAGASYLGVTWIPGAWWMWLAGGAIGEGALVLSTLQDQKFYRHVINQMFLEQYNPGRIRTPELRNTLNKALEYRTLIVQEIERHTDPGLDERLMDTARGMEEWIGQIYRLAQGLDTYLGDPVIERDMQSVPRDLAAYQKQSASNMAVSVQEELQKTITLKRSQLETLETLRDTMAKARLQLDTTLAAMGTVYMQTKLLGSKDVNSSRAQRLQADMLEQVRALEDTQHAMDELYRTNLSVASHR